jgi:hypothetical protein
MCGKRFGGERMKHKSYCGKEIIDKKTKKVIINCGDDLGGFNGEFAQCHECVEKDLEEKE